MVNPSPGSVHGWSVADGTVLPGARSGAEVGESSRLRAGCGIASIRAT